MLAARGEIGCRSTIRSAYRTVCFRTRAVQHAGDENDDQSPPDGTVEGQKPRDGREHSNEHVLGGAAVLLLLNVRRRLLYAVGVPSVAV